MSGRTHVLAGVLVTGATILYTPVPVYSVIGIIGAVMPDYDRMFGLKHRGISHSLLAPFIIGLIGSIFNFNIAVVLFINYTLHLILDSFTVMGVPFFMPATKKYYGMKLIYSGGSEDAFISLVLMWIIAEIFRRL